VNVVRPPAGKKIDDFQLTYAVKLMDGKIPEAGKRTSAAESVWALFPVQVRP